jgi:O-antigen/teichoic acid export membrane protein
MFTLKRLKESRAARIAAASYFAFASNAVYGLVSIPIAVHYLSMEQLGLWASVNAMVAYLLWMDLGVGNATGRKIAAAVVARDSEGINTWWTATQLALWVLGALTVITGLCGVPLFIALFKIPQHLHQDAWMLLSGCVLIAGITFPLRGVPGLVTAQERFHWIPVCQGLSPWIQLSIFFLMVSSGHGLKSYLYATAASQVFTFIYYRVLIATSDIRPRFERKRISMARFKELFSFSLNLAIVGFKDTFMESIPTLVIARIGGLHLVPIYTISSRVAGMLASLSNRTVHSFYPSLVNLHVAGKGSEFLAKHQRSVAFTTSISLLGAALVLLCNRSVVTLLAGVDFYVGDAATAWFALLVMTGPIAANYACLLQISGNMGKSIPISFINLLGVLGAAVAAYHVFEMPGLAAVFAVQPLFYGVYGLIRGSRNCNYGIRAFTKRPLAIAWVAMLAVLLFGSLVDSSRSLIEALPQIHQKILVCPSLSQCLGFTVLTAGAFMIAYQALFQKRLNHP